MFELTGSGQRFGIYARFSSTMQNPKSIDDQIAVCRQRVLDLGGVVAETYSDAAASGASMRDREGLQRLVTDARNGRFEAVCAEALDRLSRDQADMALLFKRFRYYGVNLITLEEGDVTSLHIGMKGVMNEVYLETIANKTRRGHKGRVREGRSAGGLSYGYKVANRIGENGEFVRGLREIDPEQAEVVRRVFRMYAEGQSTRTIAAALNADGIPSPRGKLWTSVTINGHRQRRHGLLNNEVYRGKLLYGRTRVGKDPDTDKRRAKMRPASKWLVTDVPEWRIVGDELWEAVQARRQAGHHRRGGARTPLPLSGLVMCGVCGGRMTIAARRRYGCMKRRETGACANGRRIHAAELEKRAVAEMIAIARQADWREVLDCGRAAAISRREKLKAAIEDAERRVGVLVRAVETGADAQAFHGRIVALEQEIGRDRLALRSLANIPERLPPITELARRLDNRLKQIARAVGNGGEAERKAALLRLRNVIERIEVTPLSRDYEIAVRQHDDALIAMALEED